MKIESGGSFYLLVVATLLFASFFPALANDGNVVIDLSQTHDLKTVLEAGLKAIEYSTQSRNGREFTIPEGQSLVFRLPGGFEIQQVIQQGSMSADKEGKLTTMDFYGNILPMNEAYDVAVKVHKAFGLPLNKLEKWKKDNEGKGRNAKPYMAGTGVAKTYPHVLVEVQSSINELYPWVVGLEFGWNVLDDEKALDEKWGAEHNPRSAPGKERLSLDSPSGKTYDRKEAYREINAKQEELERQMREKDALNAASSKDKQALRTKKPEQPKASPSESKSWLVWLIVVISATVGAAWLLLHKRK